MILAINGSTNEPSANARLLEGMAKHYSSYAITIFKNLERLPLFIAKHDHNPYSDEVKQWKSAVRKSSAVIITTPAYLKNIPAALKNGLEWLSSSGELTQKPVLAMTYSPHPPRGKEAMQSLLWTLGALNARVVGQLALYQNELMINEEGKLIGDEGIELIQEGLILL